MGPVKALQEKFDLRPLSQLDNAQYVASAATLPPMPDISGDDLGFFVHLGYAVQHNERHQIVECRKRVVDKSACASRSYSRSLSGLRNVGAISSSSPRRPISKYPKFGARDSVRGH